MKTPGIAARRTQVLCGRPAQVLWIRKFRNESQWSELTYLLHISTSSLNSNVPATYMYFMLLLKLGCMLSGCHLKMYITNAQLRLAKTGQAFACIRDLVCSDSSCVGKAGSGVCGDGAETDRRASARTTLAKTNMTIYERIIMGLTPSPQEHHDIPADLHCPASRPQTLYIHQAARQ